MEVGIIHSVMFEHTDLYLITELPGTSNVHQKGHSLNHFPDFDEKIITNTW